MPLSLDGTGLITGISTFSFSDDLVHVGDDNTKISFPANDTISFETAGTEKVRITSGGQLNVGSNIKLGAAGIVTATSFSGSGENLTYTTQLSHRNKIINGAMRVSQRATSVTDASAGYHTVDRMRMSKNSISTAEMTHEQSTDSPNGFSKSVKVTTTTAEGSVGATDAFRPLQYKFEGQNLQDLAYGTSDAKTLTLSFHVKSSVTGTYSVAFRNITAGTYRLRSTTYTINSANTWEKKIITIAGDTSTAIIDDNSNRFEIYWCGGSGSDFTSSNVAASGWADYVSAGLHYGQTAQLQNTLNSTFLITGVQLEVGDTATPYEHRTFGEELAQCQRYYYPYRSILKGSSDGGNHPWIPVQMFLNSSSDNDVFVVIAGLNEQRAKMRTGSATVTVLAPLNSAPQTSAPSAGQWAYFYRGQGSGYKSGGGAFGWNDGYYNMYGCKSIAQPRPTQIMIETNAEVGKVYVELEDEI